MSIFPRMAKWLDKIKAALQGGNDPPAQSRVWLMQAQRRRLRVELVPLSSHADGKLLNTTIEQIRLEDMVVAQPSIGIHTKPLITGERFQISFVTTRGRVAGDTRVIGRLKIASGGNRMFYGYRLEIPEDVVLVNQPVAEVDEQDDAGSTEAELHSLSSHGNPVRGLVIDLNQTWLQLRSRNAVGRITPGDDVYLKVTLPEPIGELTEMVTVADMQPGRTDGEITIRVSFAGKLERLKNISASILKEQPRETDNDAADAEPLRQSA